MDCSGKMHVLPAGSQMAAGDLSVAVLLFSLVLFSFTFL